jgi:iron complex outermembrane receptor protein
MKRKLFTTLIIFILILQSFAAISSPMENRPPTDANIFGHVIDAENEEHIPFVNIIIKDTRIGAITDASGHYIITNLPPGKHILIAQSMGYARTEVEFEAISDRSVEVDIILKKTGIDLDEVVLTASPTGSGFRYQPDDVLTGEMLQRRSEPSFGEMLNGKPGVAMRSMGSAPARPVIRGMDGDRILILENGERMGDISETSADHSISLDPLVASRLEVVRGPASLLYGSSALGGVINLMTTDIPDQWDKGLTGVASGQGATMNEMGAGFGRLTYGSETWAASGRFAMRKAGNITTPNGIVSETLMQNFDGALGVGINNGSLIGGISISFADQTFQIPEDPDPEEVIELRADRLSVQGRFGREFKGLFFDKAQLRFNAAQFGQQEVVIITPEGQPSEEEVPLNYGQRAISSTLTLQHRAAGIFDRGALGFSFMGQTLEVGGFEAYTPGEQKITAAIFTFQEIPLSNILRLQMGLRLDYQNSKALQNDVYPDIDQSRNSFNYSGSIGLNIRPVESIEIGGQFARSHRNPRVEELFSNGVHLGAGVFEVGNPDLLDEIGHGGDLFMRFTRGIAAIELAAFVNDFQNYIVFQPTGQIHQPSGYPIFEYLEGRARLYGGELSGAFSLVNGLSLNSGIDLVYGNRVDPLAEDENLPFIPPLRFNNMLEYDFGVGWIGTTIQMVDAQNRVAPDEEVTEGYTLLGFQAGYRLNFNGRHVFILRLENALNESYRDHLSRIEDRNVYMPGRNFNLTYRWFF